MNTLNIITDINTYLKTENKAILTDLLNALQIEYRHEEAKKKGGNVALKRQKIAEKILKQNQKDGMKEQFFKCWIEEIDGERMQFFGNQYYIIALKEAFKTSAETETEAEKITFKASKFFDKSQYTLNQIDFDLTEIKQYLAQFKAEQKQKPPKQRENRCVIPFGNIVDRGYNAEFLIDIIEALGTDAVFYQNQNSNGISIFEAEAGTALICPCRL